MSDCNCNNNRSLIQNHILEFLQFSLLWNKWNSLQRYLTLISNWWSIFISTIIFLFYAWFSSVALRSLNFNIFSLLLPMTLQVCMQEPMFLALKRFPSFTYFICERFCILNYAIFYLFYIILYKLCLANLLIYFQTELLHRFLNLILPFSPTFLSNSWCCTSSNTWYIIRITWLKKRKIAVTERPDSQIHGDSLFFQLLWVSNFLCSFYKFPLFFPTSRRGFFHVLTNLFLSIFVFSSNFTSLTVGICFDALDFIICIQNDFTMMRNSCSEVWHFPLLNLYRLWIKLWRRDLLLLMVRDQHMLLPL